MRTEYAFDIDNSVLRQIGSDFVNTVKQNWKADTNKLHSEFYSDFEYNLDADYAIDYVGVKVYFKNDMPVAWADNENLYGYKET